MTLVKRLLEEENNLTPEEKEDILQEAILDKNARKKLVKLDYNLKRMTDEHGEKLVITNKNITINFGHSLKDVYYFSVNKLYANMFPTNTICGITSYPTKIELSKKDKEWHIGVTPKNQVYTSFSERRAEVRKVMLECAEFYKKP
jgi:hypothetical protein